MEINSGSPDLYRVAFETRNFEISLFWKRSNYFLVLNTAIAVGSFGSLKTGFFHLMVAAGFIVSVLWLLTNLGSKFWQSRWEQRLRDLETELGFSVRLFSAGWDEIREDVSSSLEFSGHSRLRRPIDRLVLRKFSVSLMMILLSLTFVCLWPLAWLIAVL